MLGAKLDASWTFEPVGLNSLRIDGPSLTIADLPATAELSIQTQLVRGLRINGTAVDLAAAPADTQFDLSYCRVPVAKLLRVGENSFQVETDEAKPLPFLPALILWGRFAVDAKQRIVAPAKHLVRRRGQAGPVGLVQRLRPAHARHGDRQAAARTGHGYWHQSGQADRGGIDTQG